MKSFFQKILKHLEFYWGHIIFPYKHIYDRAKSRVYYSLINSGTLHFSSPKPSAAYFGIISLHLSTFIRDNRRKKEKEKFSEVQVHFSILKQVLQEPKGFMLLCTPSVTTVPLGPLIST